MADAFKLKNLRATQVFDFMGTLKLVRGSVEFESAAAGGLVAMPFRLIGRQAATGGLLVEHGELVAMLEQAKRWHRVRTEHDSIWLHWASKDETDKRALVYDWAQRILATPTTDGFIDNDAVQMALAITRHPYWENINSDSYGAVIRSAGGGVFDMRSNISGGDVDGRISQLSIVPGGSGQDFTTIWLGIRPPHHLPSASSFTAHAECEDGAGFDADTTTSTQTDAYGGTPNCLATSFGTVTTLAHRWSLQLSDWPTGYEGMIGRYLALLRCKLSASGTVAARLSTSWSTNPFGTTPRQVQSLRYLTNTNWLFVPLGEIAIPAASWRDGIATLSTGLPGYAINMELARISGTPTFYSDRLVLVPAEHLVVWSGPEANLKATSQGVLFTEPDDEVFGYIATSTPFEVIDAPQVAAQNWRYPHEGGVGVVVAQRNGNSVSTDTVTLSAAVVKRWLSYHG
jgi:hypothetical protein